MPIGREPTLKEMSMKIRLTSDQIADAWMHHVAWAKTIEDVSEDQRRAGTETGRQLHPFKMFAAAMARSYHSIAQAGEIDTDVTK